jgi:hypothetical protein
MGNKIVVKFDKDSRANRKEVAFAGKTVEVSPGLSLSEMRDLIEVYVKAYMFAPETEDRKPIATSGLSFYPLDAQVMLDMHLLDIKTNIKVESSHFDIDGIYASTLLSKVKDEIVNWDEFIVLLNEYKNIARAEIFSIKGLLDSFVDMQDLDMDKVQEIAKAVDTVKKKVAEDEVFSGLMKEGQNENKDL